MRIKEVREQPLLSPPPQRWLWSVGAEDWRIIESGIDEAKRSKDPHSASDYVELMFFGHMLGRPQAIDAQGSAKIRRYLERVRDEKFAPDTNLADRGYILGKCLYQLESMGVKGFRRQADVWLVDQNLWEARKGGPSSMYTEELLLFMKESGKAMEMTPEDAKGMGYWLNDFRARSGELAPSLMKKIFFRRKIGFDDSLTPKEQTLVLRELETMRAEKDPSLAEILYMMRELTSDRSGKTGEPSMPALKRISRP